MTKAWACTAGVGCAVSFISHAMPYLQFLAVLITIAAGIKALWPKGQK